MSKIVLKSWKYNIPDNCYRATEWCGSGCTSGELTILASECQIHFRDPKKDMTFVYPVMPDTIYRVEDSSRYFVLLANSQATGIGFKSREESKVFADCIKTITACQFLNVYSRRDKEKIDRILNKYQKADTPKQTETQPQKANTPKQIETCQIIELNQQPQNAKDDHIADGIVRTTRASYAPPPEQPLHPTTATTQEKSNEPSSTTTQSSQSQSSTSSQSPAENSNETDTPNTGDVQQQSTRKHLNEDFTQEAWRKHKKHMFMLSIAGKPIYSRYGDEQQLSPFTATLSALLSFVVDADDTLRYFVAGERQFVFYVHGPIALACICSTGEPRADLQRQMFHVYQQVALLLSSKTIMKFLHNRPGCDLRSLMSPSDFSLLDYVVHSYNHQLGAIFNAYQPLPLKKGTRDAIDEKVVTTAAKCKNILFTALFAGHELIHIGSQPRLTLDPVDLQMLMNFVGSSKALRSNRTWTPLCLPMLDDGAFVNGYIRSVTDTVTLVIISPNRDSFYSINECADSIVDDLKRPGVMEEIVAPQRITVEKTGIHSLIHFAFVATGYRQVVAPEFPVLHGRNNVSVQKRVFRAYKTLRANAEPAPANLLSMAGNELGPHSFTYKMIGGETFVLWMSKMFELYVAFSVVKSKSQAVSACNNIISLILQDEEVNFITSNAILK